MRKLERICLVVASEMTVTAFLMGHLRALAEKYDVTVVANTGNHAFLKQRGLDVSVVPVAIARDVHPLADLSALFSLIRLFRKEHFDLVHSVTPKAGLLAMLAGIMAGVRFRIHTFTGQVWVTRTGFSRFLLKTMDRLLAQSATHLLADSSSQRQFLIDQGIASPERLNVLADGSISGVDAERFKPDVKARSAVRKQLNLGDEDVLLLFLGRLNRDKGVLDLAGAFAIVADVCPQLHMLLVGPDEGGLKRNIQDVTRLASQRVHFMDYTDRPEMYFATADIFCLPSYREGFGSVIIEAAACGVPAIGSNIYGVSDAIEDGKSGLLFPCGDVAALSDCMQQLAMDDGMRVHMGEYARQRALHDFSSNLVTQAWLRYYEDLL